ncbi:MAG: hypothetical protein IH852_04280 [Bacteroidetes bacterium]|nr:hypothetical protein [Bacteroidota bacterium]
MEVFLRVLEKDYSYYRFFTKLCDGEYTTGELNNFIERLFKIGESYLNHRYSRIKNLVNSNQDTLEEIAIEAIAPLFKNANYNNHFNIVDDIRNWNPPINSENESLFFLNKIISNRMEQHISRMLRESDPFFSRILDSVNYLIRTGGYKKVSYLGKVHITEPKNSNINWIVITDDEFYKIPTYLFYESKILLKSLFYFIKTETQYFPAIPLNELIFRLKHINLSDYLSSDYVNDISDKIEISEILNIALSYTEKKLKSSYLDNGKLTIEEYESFKCALKTLAADLGDGGVNPCLYKYLAPYISGLTKEEYQKKYHNILEYLLKQLKSKIAKELR